MNSELKIRPCKDSDRDMVLSLLDKVFSKQERSVSIRSSKLWEWKIKSSPFGKSMVTVAEYDGNIIGVDHLWPWQLTYRGNVIKAYQPCDLAVHPDFRGKGLFKKMRMHGVEYARNNGFQLIFNFPNENSLPANQSLGWNYLGKIDWWVRVLKPLNLLKGKLKPGKADYADIPEHFKPDCDLLDQIANNQERSTPYLRINRIPGFHQHRYAAHPNRSYGMIVEGEGLKQCAAVFTLNRKGKITEMVVVDFVGSKKSVPALYKRLISNAKSLNADFIAFMDNPEFDMRYLWKSGFVKVKQKNLAVLPLDNIYAPVAGLIEHWSLVAGLHDSI